jgi:YVTN family beta-propeller protein
MYIVNSFSQNVTVFQNRDYVTDIPTASWPTGISVDPSSARTWVTNLHSGVSLLENTAQVGFVPRDYEPYGVAFNPVNGYAYVSDLDSKVQIINGDQLVTTLRVTDPVTGKGAGWLRAIVVDSQTGLVYVASWDYGKLYVIDGVNVVNSVQLGWGPLNMALDEVRGLLYVAHSEPNAQYPHNISVVDLEKLTVSFVASAPTVRTNSHGVAVDARSGYAYVTNPEAKTVTILQGTTILDNVAVGERPWGVGVNPRDGYVYVTNRGSNDVSVIQRSAVIATIPVQGVQPFAVGVDTTNNDVYIANRGTEPALFECEQGSVTILH